jgi:hypothetical protein
MLTSEDLLSSLGGDIVALASSSVDALLKNAQFQLNQAIHTPPYDYFRTMSTQPCEIFIKGDHE